MGIYLEDHPPARRQFYNPRRATVTGAIVVHTAENATDLVLPDHGAEGVASFISRRSDPGSYHIVVDSDSIVRVGRPEWEMFHEGTGGNRWSLGLSFACQAHQWATPKLVGWEQPALRNGGEAAAELAEFVQDEISVDVPAKRITEAEYRAGKPGFISHAELDPGRRSDPGLMFPWDEFLHYYEVELGLVFDVPEADEDMYKEAMQELDELWLAYRGVTPPSGDRRSWGRDMAEKHFRRGIDLQPTLAYVEWVLREEFEGIR